MPIISFRGQSKESGQLVYGYFVRYKDEFYIFESEEIRKGIDLGGYLDCCRLTEIIPETLSMYMCADLCNDTGDEVK